MRLRDYDYRNEGYYFITAVTGCRQQCFGRVESDGMILSDEGKIADEEMVKCQVLKDYVFIDEYVIMPDHVHFIMIISNCQPHDPVTCYETEENDNYFSLISPKASSVSSIVRSYKSSVTRRCRVAGFTSFAWQRGFYDRIIRDQNELDAIRKYIRLNPERWRQRNSYHS